MKDWDESMVKKYGLIVLLFLTGVFLLFYPQLENKIQTNKQNKLLTDWGNYIATIEPVSKTSSNTDSLSADERKSPSAESADLSSSVPKPQASIAGVTLLGTLNIPAIDVTQPILQDSTEHTLKYGVGTVVPDIAAGEFGNFALAGHRGRSYGKLLNRLNELEAGDEIIVQSASEEYSYSVTEKFLVKPDEVWVLEQDDSMRELTLITCHPVKNPTHRLIIKAIIS